MIRFVKFTSFDSQLQANTENVPSFPCPRTSAVRPAPANIYIQRPATTACLCANMTIVIRISLSSLLAITITSVSLYMY
jgi:hypothetical protein